jgi:hypothetical protein
MEQQLRPYKVLTACLCLLVSALSPPAKAGQNNNEPEPDVQPSPSAIQRAQSILKDKPIVFRNGRFELDN